MEIIFWIIGVVLGLDIVFVLLMIALTYGGNWPRREEIIKKEILEIPNPNERNEGIKVFMRNTDEAEIWLLERYVARKKSLPSF